MWVMSKIAGPNIFVTKEHVMDSKRNLFLCVLEKLKGIGWTEDTENHRIACGLALEDHSIANILYHVHLVNSCV